MFSDLITFLWQTQFEFTPEHMYFGDLIIIIRSEDPKNMRSPINGVWNFHHAPKLSHPHCSFWSEEGLHLPFFYNA